MGHTYHHDNYRVEVVPEKPWRGEHANWTSALEDLRKEIRRHCDGVASATVQWDSTRVCEHCGEEWIEDKDSPHNGGCCKKDREVLEKIEAECVDVKP